MDDGRAPAPRERGWKRFVLALAAFLLISKIPAFAAVAPVEDALLLLLPAVTVCFAAGWWTGGRLPVAIIWAALTVWVMSIPAPPGSVAYHDIARGWGLVGAGAFGVVCLSDPDRPFLYRVLPALGITMLLALLVLTVAPDGWRQAHSVFAEQFAARNGRWAAQMQLVSQQLGTQAPSTSLRLGAWTAQYLQWLDSYSAFMVAFYPAVLALESLSALAIGWGLYHRLSRVRLGPPLAPLRMFTFNDQLIWGLVVGLALVLVPSLDALAVVGKNLLAFFGVLYALRGLGVLASLLARTRKLAIVALVILGVLLWPLVLSAALVLGVSDTWADWRLRARMATPPRRPGSPS
jgi:hypothetical protein